LQARYPMKRSWNFFEKKKKIPFLIYSAPFISLFVWKSSFGKWQFPVSNGLKFQFSLEQESYVVKKGFLQTFQLRKMRLFYKIQINSLKCKYKFWIILWLLSNSIVEDILTKITNVMYVLLWTWQYSFLGFALDRKMGS